MIDVHPLGPAARPPRKTRGSLRGRRTAAVAGSLAIHAGLFLLIFSSAAGHLVSAAGASGGPTGPVFTVTVVRMPATALGHRQGAAAAELLLAKLHLGTVGQALPVTPGQHRSELSALVEHVSASQASPAASDRLRRAREADLQGARYPSPNPISKSERPTDGRHPDGDGEATGSASTGNLWGAIEPCWRNLGARGRVPVVLDVALDATGDLRTPPKVIRSTSALITEPRLQAEASALAAVAACAPRGDLKFGGKTYRLEFPAAP